MDTSNAKREEEQPITGDMIDNIGTEVDIHIMQKKKEKKNKEIKTVLKYITACLNTDGGVVTLKNNDWKDAPAKNMDEWYGIVERNLFDESSKFIKFEGTYQDRILQLRITPLHYLFSVDMHLYFPRNTDIVEVKYTQAIEILKTNDKSGSLSELPAIEEYFEHNKKMSKLSENDQIQFKEIRSDNIPSKFSSTINKYISAFCNHKGGRILFGIEDKEFKVVGVELTNEDKESINDNVEDKIDEEIYIYIQNKKKEEKNIIIKAVMKCVCACLNSNGGVVKLKNQHWNKAIGKDLDDWYNDLEKQLFDDSSKFIELEGKYNDKILTLRIRPLNYVFSCDMYLYFPRNTDIVAVRYNQAIDILRTNDKSGSLTELPAVGGVFEYQKTLPTLSENDQIQFKEIKSAKVPSKFSSMINKYISAFCNHKGGRIFFGIEDKEFKVVGVPLTKQDKDSITRIMYAKMDQTMKWGCDNKTYVYGIHWSIDFLPVNNPNNIKVTIPEGASLEVIVVSVCRYPGGVFTDTPNSYYIREEDRTIQQFTFQEWKTKMISSHKGIPFTQGCGEVLQTSVDNLFVDVSDTNKTVHNTQRGVLCIKEMLSDLVENSSLSSIKQKRSRGTEVLQEENCEIFQANQTETTPQEESQKSTAKKRQVSLPETETTSSKPKILVSPIARSTDPETTCIQTETSKEETSTADDLHELQVRYLKSKLEKMEKEKRKLDLENEKLERQASHEQNQSRTFEQTREALRLIANQTEETSLEESLNGSKLNCTATKRQVLLPETETTSNKPKILVPPLARPTDHEITCHQNEPKMELKSTADDIQELQVKVLTGKLEKLEKKKKKLDLEIGCLERRDSQEQNNLMTFEQFCGALGLTADKVDLKRQMTLHQLKTTSSRKIANVAPLERQTDTEKTVHQTSTTSVSQEQVFEM